MILRRVVGELLRAPKVTWVLLALILLFASRSEAFLSPNNIATVGAQGAVLAIIALGATLVILSGGVDLSMGTLMSLSGVVAVMAINRGLPTVPGLLLGLLTGTAVGVVNGVLVTFGRVPPFIATLGTLGIAQGLALVLTQGSSQIAPQGLYRQIGNGSVLGVPTIVILAVLVFLLAYYILYHLPFGTYIMAFGSNEDAAAKVGINVRRWKIGLYAFSGLLSGLGGLALSSRMSTAHPLVGLGWEFDAVAAAVLGGTALEGGRGGIAGTILGVALIAVLRNGLNLIRLPSNWQHAATGIVIMLALVVEVVLSQRQHTFAKAQE